MPTPSCTWKLRTLLYQLLKDYLGSGATVGSDPCVYYASDPRKAVAPDVYVQLRAPIGKLESWKVWERGAPDVAVEILSDSDASELAWAKKTPSLRGARRHRVGVFFTAGSGSPAGLEAQARQGAWRGCANSSGSSDSRARVTAERDQVRRSELQSVDHAPHVALLE